MNSVRRTGAAIWKGNSGTEPEEVDDELETLVVDAEEIVDVVLDEVLKDEVDVLELDMLELEVTVPLLIVAVEVWLVVKLVVELEYQEKVVTELITGPYAPQVALMV